MTSFAIVIGVASYSISQNIREGLLEAFYGVYEKSPDKVMILFFPDGSHIVLNTLA
jgi:hypothetical protein